MLMSSMSATRTHDEADRHEALSVMTAGSDFGEEEALQSLPLARGATQPRTGKAPSI